MSTLLDEIIAARKAKAIEYEEYLKRIAELTRQVTAGHGDETDERLKRSPALRAVYNNLKKNASRLHAAQSAGDASGDPVLDLAMKIDQTVKDVRPDAWRGHAPRENMIKAALLSVLGGDMDAVLELFPVIVAQAEY